ncbi:MAG: hypothetical protein HRT57_05095 [Crocinitomicaceae bacterium]|nr:hypothetical protein [Crocinitomicaceae bacterium]
MKIYIFIVTCLLILMSCKKTIPVLIDNEWLLIGYSIDGNYQDVQGQNHLYNFIDKENASYSPGPGNCNTVSGNYKITKYGQIEFGNDWFSTEVGCEEMGLEINLFDMNEYEVGESDLKLSKGGNYMVFVKI